MNDHFLKCQINYQKRMHKNNTTATDNKNRNNKKLQKQ